MTPNEIEVLIHYYVSPEDHPRINSPAVKEALRRHIKAGLLTSDSKELTERGRFMITMLCSTPLPVSKTEWEDPREITWPQ